MTGPSNAGRAWHRLDQVMRWVFLKEWREGLRDRRAMAHLLIPALVLGPLILGLLTILVAQIESRIERRSLMAVGLAKAPSLENYILRQGYTVQFPPEGYEHELRAGRLQEAILVVPSDFETQLSDGANPEVEIHYDASQQRANLQLRTVQNLLQGFIQERSVLALAMRGVATDALKVMSIRPRDLASQQSRASQLLSFMPMTLLMMVAFGVLTCALDVTAGERERGSLQALMLNPVSPWALVLGKWAFVTTLGVVVAIVLNLSFLLAHQVIDSDALAAMFRFSVGQALLCVGVQSVLAAMMAAVIMAIAMRCRSAKEAQSGATLVLSLVSLAPLLSMIDPGSNPLYRFWLPGLAHFEVLMLILKGEPVLPHHVAPMLLISTLITALALQRVARSMRHV